MIRLPHLPALLALTLLVCPAHAETITGKPRIIDGDTIEVAGTRIRLEGMDAGSSRLYEREKFLS